MRSATVALLFAATSAAAEPNVRLVSEGKTCTLDSLPAHVQGLLGRDPFDDSARAEVRIELLGDPKHPQATVAFHDDGGMRGPRSLASTSCDALIDAIALVIAMGMPHDAPSPHVVEAPPVEVVAVAAGELALVHAIAKPTERLPNEFDVTAGGAAAISSNGWTQQLAVGARWRRRRNSLALELRLDSPEQRAVTPMGEVGLATTFVSGVACRHFGSVGLCVAVSGGEVRGTGMHLIAARTALTPLVGFGARAGWEYPLVLGLRARVEIGADVLATTSRFDVDHIPVWSSSPWSAWAGIGAIARFL